jgi:hypothetical protein
LRLSLPFWRERDWSLSHRHITAAASDAAPY